MLFMLFSRLANCVNHHPYLTNAHRSVETTARRLHHQHQFIHLAIGLEEMCVVARQLILQFHIFSKVVAHR